MVKVRHINNNRYNCSDSTVEEIELSEFTPISAMQHICGDDYENVNEYTDNVYENDTTIILGGEEMDEIFTLIG